MPPHMLSSDMCIQIIFPLTRMFTSNKTTFDTLSLTILIHPHMFSFDMHIQIIFPLGRMLTTSKAAFDTLSLTMLLHMTG